jgi:hypothetical protein
MICNEKRIEELYHNDCEGDYVEAFEHLTKEHLTTTARLDDTEACIINYQQLITIKIFYVITYFYSSEFFDFALAVEEAYRPLESELRLL